MSEIALAKLLRQHRAVFDYEAYRHPDSAPPYGCSCGWELRDDADYEDHLAATINFYVIGVGR